MATPSASPDGEVRAGSRILTLFASPLIARILRAHVDGPMRLSEIHEQLSWTPHTTLRAAVTKLCEVGALGKSAADDPRSSSLTTLTPAGEEMIDVAEAVDRWLAACPRGPISPNSEEAKAAVKALAGGWNTTLMRALASRPFTLTGLSTAIPDISYPSLERRLASMRATGQIEAVEASERGTPYVVTEWARRAVAPLCVAGRCERRYLPEETAPITDVEVEASFMLVLPLAPLPPTAQGAAMLAVQTQATESQEQGQELAGITVEVRRGEVVSSLTEVNENPETWALGTAEAWLNAVIDGRLGELRFGGGKPQLAADLVNGLHVALFG